MSKQEALTAAEYQQLYGNKKAPLPKDFVKKITVKKGRPSASESPVIDSLERGEGFCVITIAGTIPGLNGSDGLLREHWGKRIKRKEALALRLSRLHPPLFDGKVIITMTGYSSVLNDWENFCAKFKLAGDALVDMGVLQDDSPKYVTKFTPLQEKCRRKDARLEIRIDDINTCL